MRKRIFLSFCFVSLLIVILAATFFTGVFFSYINDEFKDRVSSEALHMGGAIELSLDRGIEYGEYIKTLGKESKHRITLITSDGTVLYDNFALPENMDSHLLRPEVKSAIETGSGESLRFSDTLDKKIYYYAIRISDGSILRVAYTTKSEIGIMGDSLVWFIILSLFLFSLSLLIAKLLTDSIIKPINRLNLDNPLQNDTYDELSPLLSRMEKQNKEIHNQISQLSAQRQEFEYITDNMSEGLILLKSDGVVLSANKSAEKIINAQAGKLYLEISRNIDFIGAVEYALAGNSSSIKIELSGKVYDITVNPVHLGKTSYAAVLFIADITEKEQPEKMRREFSANVSHELKTPLTSIMGYAEIIKNGIAKPDDISHCADMIYNESLRLLQLINDIIKLSRLDENILKGEFEQVNLGSLCKSVVDNLSDKARKLNVKFELDLQPVVINGCKPVLYEMIYNLCDNAVIYNKDCGNVTIKLSGDEKNTELTVSDTGIGIEQNHQSRIFERFYRVDKSHSKRTGGTGLGLSIVKHGAILHNAVLELESEIGKGTTVRICFDIKIGS